MNAVCFGDSNTYGYDPRGPIADRLPETWCSLLGIRNLGENGRTVPRTDWEAAQLQRWLAAHPETETVLILLGTNDLLMGYGVQRTADAMDAFLSALVRDFPGRRFLLLSPPPIAFPEVPLDLLAEHYAALAKHYGISFLDIHHWPLPLAHDGVHLSEEGHKTLAQLLSSQL